MRVNSYEYACLIDQFWFRPVTATFPTSFKFCRVHVYHANSIRIPFVFYFLGQDPFSIGIKFYIHHFLYILSKAQHPLYINMVYKWHDLRFIRLHPSIWIFKYLKPLLCWNPMYAFLANCLQLMCVSCRGFLLLKHV